jgi:hypothetical protein
MPFHSRVIWWCYTPSSGWMRCSFYICSGIIGVTFSGSCAVVSNLLLQLQCLQSDRYLILVKYKQIKPLVNLHEASSLKFFLRECRLLSSFKSISLNLTGFGRVWLLNKSRLEIIYSSLPSLGKSRVCDGYACGYFKRWINLMLFPKKKKRDTPITTTHECTHHTEGRSTTVLNCTWSCGKTLLIIAIKWDMTFPSNEGWAAEVQRHEKQEMHCTKSFKLA